jgi:hypothetical protein
MCSFAYLNSSLMLLKFTSYSVSFLPPALVIVSPRIAPASSTDSSLNPASKMKVVRMIASAEEISLENLPHRRTIPESSMNSSSFKTIVFAVNSFYLLT